MLISVGPPLHELEMLNSVESSKQIQVDQRRLSCLEMTDFTLSLTKFFCHPTFNRKANQQSCFKVFSPDQIQFGEASIRPGLCLQIRCRLTNPRLSFHHLLYHLLLHLLSRLTSTMVLALQLFQDLAWKSISKEISTNPDLNFRASVWSIPASLLVK